MIVIIQEYDGWSPRNGVSQSPPEPYVNPEIVEHWRSTTRLPGLQIVFIPAALAALALTTNWMVVPATAYAAFHLAQLNQVKTMAKRTKTVNELMEIKNERTASRQIDTVCGELRAFHLDVFAVTAYLFIASVVLNVTWLSAYGDAVQLFGKVILSIVAAAVVISAVVAMDSAGKHKFRGSAAAN